MAIMEDTAFDSEDARLEESRDYQREMLQESLRKNIILAMDTGSGKTHIAVLRIEAELERCSPEKLVWFLCPTVALAQQQHLVLQKHIRFVRTILLSGNDGINRWSEQRNWNEVLLDVKVIVSTHQVLLDALIHGFIRMGNLALLIFDEAHHCISSHPANRIMQDFYHPRLVAGKSVPHVLGLTASPIMNSKGGGLQKIEKNINAISKTPKVYRNELLQYVHQPEVVTLTYQSKGLVQSSLLQHLTRLFSDLDIETDPAVVKLRKANQGRISSKLSKVLISRKTYCRDQIRSLWSMATAVNEELGPWAADLYIVTCIKKFRDRRSNGAFNFENLEEDEWGYLIRTFASFPTPEAGEFVVPEECDMSPKVLCLLQCLDTEIVESFAGLIFVETRASAGLLARLISHTHSVDVGTFVGTSNSDKHKSSISELHGLGDQSETLDDLRSGRKKLIVTTSVLEEGIDVAVCNVVICFQAPLNLKSWIQRKGRARSSKSKYIIMLEEGSKDAATNWQQLEEDMKQLYMDDMRKLAEVKTDEIDEEGSDRMFIVESTGAKIAMADAVGHLYHFCASLPKAQYADSKPLFLFEEDSEGRVRGSVLLPKSVDKDVRETNGTKFWASERLAKQDAAMEAYIALYRANLLNDNVLPLIAYDAEALQAYADVKKRPSLVSVRQYNSPWSEIALACQMDNNYYQHIISFSGGDSQLPPLRMLCPYPLSWMKSLTLYLTATSIITVNISCGRMSRYNGDISISDDITRVLLWSIFRGRMQKERSGFPLRFEPAIATETMKTWLDQVSGTISGDALQSDIPKERGLGLVRDVAGNGKPYVLEGLEFHIPGHFTIRLTDTGDKVEELHFRRPNPDPKVAENSPTEGDTAPTTEASAIPEPVMCAKVTKWTRRTDFLHKVSSSNALKKSETCAYLPLSMCTVDSLPVSYAQVALLLPSIIHHIENTLVTDHLCETLLSSVDFKKRALVDTAITATSACEADNYQNLELLGDTCLKLYASITIMSQHLNWHEGYLTHQKDHLVSNGRLALAAQETGLDQYIRTKTFTGLKWRPKYNEDLLAESSAGARDLSSKTLADVVEALLGAAYLDGGETRILRCLSLFLSEMPWQPLAECRKVLLGASTPNDYIPFPAHFVHLEYLIGHVFTTKPLLLEALTHPSHLGPDKTPSYDRLEFCGDSVLDFIITTRIFRHSSSLSTFRMHLLRTAMVNANFLGFVCMSRSILLSSTMSITRTSAPHAKEVPLAIWHFMRHSHSYDMINAQSRCHARFVALQPAINDALNYGKSYPWTLLCTLGPEKFFSDLIESVIAAIYIDTAGSLAACEKFLTALGIMPYLDRVLKEEIHVMHPKEELGVLAGNDTVSYAMMNRDDDEDDGFATEGVTGRKDRPKGYRVKVLLGGAIAAVARGARTRIEAETKAAEEAIMRLNKGLFKLGGNVDKEKSSSGKGDLSTRRAMLEKKATTGRKPKPVRKAIPERKARPARKPKAARVTGEDSSDEDEALDDLEEEKDLDLEENGELEDYVEPEFGEEERLGEVKRYEVDENGIVYDTGEFDEDRMGREDSVIFSLASVRASEEVDERKVLYTNGAVDEGGIMLKEEGEVRSLEKDRDLEMDEDGIVFDDEDTYEPRDVDSPGIVFEDDEMEGDELNFVSAPGVSVAVTLAYRNSQAGPHRCARINPKTGKRCDMAFSRPCDLARHETAIHSLSKQRFRCQLCTGEKTFCRKDLLSKHIRVVHSEVDSYDTMVSRNGMMEDAGLKENGILTEEVEKAIKREAPRRERSPIRFPLPDQRKSKAKVDGAVGKKVPPLIETIAAPFISRSPKKLKVNGEEATPKKAPPPVESRFRFIPRVLKKPKVKTEEVSERKAAPRTKTSLRFEAQAPKKSEIEEDGIIFDVEEVEEEPGSRGPTPVRSPMELLTPASVTPEVITPEAEPLQVAIPDIEAHVKEEEDGIIYDDEDTGGYGRNGNDSDVLMSDYDTVIQFD